MAYLDLLTRLATPTIIERLDLPARSEQRLAVPDNFGVAPTRAWLSKTLGGRDPWAHQSMALQALADRLNVVVSTGTASGKSLVFQAAGIREMLEGTGRVLAIYPQKALGADQRARWEAAVELAGLPRNTVAELHGDVVTNDRLEAIAHARVILATPDVLHAWLLRQVATPLFQQFLLDLNLMIIDEAHVYEGIFGSNAGYFFRRLHAARRRVQRLHKCEERDIQIIAATATIASPAEHLHALTGADFKTIGEDDDGSSSHARTVLHIDGPDHGAAGEAMLAELLAKLAPELSPHAFIAFHDSRQGVERIARLIDRDDVLPYRSGYEAADRTQIETALREGRLRGVVATSALELGIDIPAFVVGLNLGVPQSKKAFRQRLGRIGRASPGVFAVIAPSNSFQQFGSSLREFYESSVEPSHLYLDNRFVQFAQARCLMDECDAIDGVQQLPAETSWPESFATVFEYARYGAPRPREFDTIAEIGADRPHFNYPLRQIGEYDYALNDSGGSSGDRLGTIRLHQAIREAYPGATYIHLRQPKKVSGWKSSTYERSIRLDRAHNPQPTTPILVKTVNASTAAGDVIEGRIQSGDRGFLAEVRLQVNESVEGYRVGNTSFLYSDLRKANANMTRKQRDFSTTGVVLRIDEPWFSGTATDALKTRQAVARSLKQLLARERSLALADIDFADSNVALMQKDGPRKTTDTIVIYDSIHGGLRLTESLYANFGQFLDRLAKAAEVVGEESLVSAAVAQKLIDWFKTLQQHHPVPDVSTASLDEGELLVFAPRSEVGVRVRGELVSRTLLKPKLVPFDGGKLLMYQYESAPGVQAWIAHDQVEATGQNWKHAIWKPDLDIIQDLAA